MSWDWRLRDLFAKVFQDFLKQLEELSREPNALQAILDAPGSSEKASTGKELKRLPKQHVESAFGCFKLAKKALNQR